MMPGLTIETNGSSPSQATGTATPHSGDSPQRSTTPPPYSPITPVLAAARLATNGSAAVAPSTNNHSNAPGPPSRTYTHSQPPQTFIEQPQPAPEAISLDDNPDAIALRSAISILQMQRQNAYADIKTLNKISKRAREEPQAFVEALARGEIKTKPDPIFDPRSLYDEDDDDDDEDEKQEAEESKDRMDGVENGTSENSESKAKWPYLPKPQNVIRTPPINWAQYGIVGDSLDKLHADQIARPNEGQPALLGPDGHIINTFDGQRREISGIAAPYTPGKDKIERMGTRKGGKR